MGCKVSKQSLNIPHLKKEFEENHRKSRVIQKKGKHSKSVHTRFKMKTNAQAEAVVGESKKEILQDEPKATKRDQGSIEERKFIQKLKKSFNELPVERAKNPKIDIRKLHLKGQRMSLSERNELVYEKISQRRLSVKSEYLKSSVSHLHHHRHLLRKKPIFFKKHPDIEKFEVGVLKRCSQN